MNDVLVLTSIYFIMAQLVYVPSGMDSFIYDRCSRYDIHHLDVLLVIKEKENPQETYDIQKWAVCSSKGRHSLNIEINGVEWNKREQLALIHVISYFNLIRHDTLTEMNLLPQGCKFFPVTVSLHSRKANCSKINVLQIIMLIPFQPISFNILNYAPRENVHRQATS